MNRTIACVNISGDRRGVVAALAPGDGWPIGRVNRPSVPRADCHPHVQLAHGDGAGR